MNLNKCALPKISSRVLLALLIVILFNNSYGQRLTPHYKTGSGPSEKGDYWNDAQEHLKRVGESETVYAWKDSHYAAPSTWSIVGGQATITANGNGATATLTATDASPNDTGTVVRSVSNADPYPSDTEAFTYVAVTALTATPAVVPLNATNIIHTVTTQPAGHENLVNYTPADTSTPGIKQVIATCGISSATCSVTVVKVDSLVSNLGTEIDDFDSNPDTKTIVLRTKPGFLTITATPFPMVDEVNLPSGWTLTGGSGAGKLSRTIDTTSKGTHEVTCVCGSTSKKLTIKVVDLKIKFVPNDSFSGRSYTRMGVGEKAEMRIDVDPWVNIADATWQVVSGDASISDSAVAEAGNLVGGAATDNLSIEATVTTDPFFGETITTTLAQTRPTGTMFERNGGIRGHINDTASAAFEGTYYVVPLDVSFENTEFQEGIVSATDAWGICSGTHNHKMGSWISVSGGDITKGCTVLGVDRVRTYHEPPYGNGGGFSWVIPARFHAFGSNEGYDVDTKTHSVNITSSGRATISKQFSTETREASDVTENPQWFVLPVEE